VFTFKGLTETIIRSDQPNFRLHDRLYGADVRAALCSASGGRS